MQLSCTFSSNDDSYINSRRVISMLWNTKEDRPEVEDSGYNLSFACTARIL